ncbi:Crp/Fnr family transcriptional regulator [Streptomyces sp. NPDC048330]|uniref:Crp/Fnr family transcriptional regulator n=1 Tax=Streptomyces sp. NPDC048330 TaxID=3365533 RepID=UPI0037188EBE
MPEPYDPSDEPVMHPVESSRSLVKLKEYEAQHARFQPASEASRGGVAVRPRRSRMEVRLVSYFQALGVSVSAATMLASTSHVLAHQPGPLAIRRGAGYVDVIIAGVVADERRRLWASEWWLGDLDVFRETPALSRPRYEILSDTWTLRIDREVLRSLAMRDLTVQRMLHHVLTNRLGVHDTVYGVDQRTTLARVAQLLQYLVRRRDVLDSAHLVSRTDDVLQGPTQKDLADALGLSLASVEKSMSLLRKHHVVACTGKGRANRAYRVLRHDLLQAAAHGITFYAYDDLGPEENTTTE